MTHASIHGDHLPGQKLDGSIVEVNKKATFQRQKHFVGVRMTVPRISLRHGADADFVIVDLSNGMIIVATGRCPLARELNHVER